MTKPSSQCPVEWARYNEHQQHQRTRERVLGALKPAQFAGSRCGGKSQWVREQIERAQTEQGTETRITFDDCVRLDEMANTVEEMPGPLLDLTLAVHRAASELEGSSERGDRIALQLLTALARFERARHADSEGL